MVKSRPGVMIYFETAKAIKGLDYETKGRLFEAIMEYAEDGLVPSFDGVLAAVWPFVAERIERDAERYDSKVIQKKRASYAKWWKRYAEENGLDVNDLELRERWIDSRMQEDDANAYGCIAENADASFAMRNMPTTTVTPTVTTTATATSTATGAVTTTAGGKLTARAHGRHNNVILTECEVDSLKAQFPDWQAKVDKLSKYLADNPRKRYVSHYDTIVDWAREDAQKEVKKQNNSYYPHNPCNDVRPEDYENDTVNPF